MGNLQLSPGSLFANRFEVQRAAGSGGMGTVYRATDRYSGDTVALKLLHAGVGGPDEGERFAREAQILSELRHPGIVAHVVHGQTPDGQRFLAMEWLDGQDLGQRLTQGPLPVLDCLRLLEQVADALSVAHQRGIIHRDLKPTNLFLIEGDVGRVKILDFGIARRVATSQAMTRTGMVIGTPEYMAPEQARGSRDISPATDLFSLGCVLYECLTGQPPFVADHIAAVLVRILFEEPVSIEDRRTGISPSLSALLSRLLAKHPEQRIADAAALRSELLSLGELPEPALAATMASPRPKAESFAELEQSLFSIVLAAPAEEEIGLGATQPGSGVQLEATNRRALLQALSALGGSPDFLANGTLVVTVPSLGSAQDQATVAARAALLIKERWPDAIVSMATGRGAVRGSTAVGEVVELAARPLKRGSQPSTGKPTTGVLLDPLSAKLLEGRFVQTPQPGGALLLHEERDVDASRPLLGKPTPCVGREAELGSLDLQLAGCIEESEARVVLFTAPPGAGKSRLRHEFIRRVEKRSEPITLLLGRGDMMNAGAPYGILRTAIHKLCGISGSEPLDTRREHLRVRVAQHLAAADSDRVILFVGELCNVPFPEEGKPLLQAARQDPKIMRDCLRRALLDFLAAECAAAPVVLVLDDLQWGDELTVSVMDEALREQAGAPLFVLSFARPEVHEVFPKLWHSHKVQEIPLKGLSKKACERLIVQVLGKDVPPEAIARAVEQCAGNALFLEELIRSFAEGTSAAQSETVVAMLQARIGRLDSNARRAVRAASVFGQTFWRGGVATLLGLSQAEAEVEGWLAALVDAELIQPQAQSHLGNQSEYGFRHALIRNAAYGLLTTNDLSNGHRMAGEFLEAADEKDAAVIADHFFRGGDKLRAAKSYLEAAEESLKQGNYVGGMRQVEAGLGCDPKAELLGQLHSVASALGMYLVRVDLIQDSATIALKQLRPGSASWCRALQSEMWGALGALDGARLFAWLPAFLSADPEPDAQAIYNETLFEVAVPLTWAVPAAMLQSYTQRIRAIEAQAELSNPTIRRYLCAARATLGINREPRPWSLITDAEESVSLARQAGDKKCEMVMLVWGAVWGRIHLGDLEGVRKHLIALEPAILKSQDRRMVTFWRIAMIWALTESGDEETWRQAEQLIAASQREEADNPVGLLTLEGNVGWIALLRGQFEIAEQRARTAMQMFPLMPAVHMSLAATLMRALLGLGRAAEAVTIADQVLGALSILGGAGCQEVYARLAATESFHASGDLERAHTEMRETLRQIQLRADDITDPFWKNSYLTRNQYCVRAQQLAREWGLDVVVK